MPVTPPPRRLLSVLVAVASACASPDKSEFDCFSLGGGYEGEDLEALQAECEADSRGTYCDASAFIESDAAKCLALGEWSEEIDSDYSAGLFYSYGYRTVLWSVPYPDEAGNALVHATTGETHGPVSGAPQ